MKIELIKYNDEGVKSYWVRVNDSLTHPKSEFFTSIIAAENYYNELIVQHNEEAKEVILKTITL